MWVNGAQSHYDFGTTPAFGSTVAASPSASQGAASQNVTAALTGLTASTTYHYRLAVTNADGTQYSSTGSFTTLTRHQNWCQTHFGSTSNAGDAADDADPDRDGLKNLLEYALNLHPNATSRMPASMQKADGTVEYTYSRATAAKNGGTTFQVEWSDNLTTWSGAGVVETLLSDDGTTQQVKATLPAGSGGRRFVRLRVQ